MNNRGCRSLWLMTVLLINLLFSLPNPSPLLLRLPTHGEDGEEDGDDACQLQGMEVEVQEEDGEDGGGHRLEVANHAGHSGSEDAQAGDVEDVGEEGGAEDHEEYGEPERWCQPAGDAPHGVQDVADNAAEHEPPTDNDDWFVVIQQRARQHGVRDPGARPHDAPEDGE